MELGRECLKLWGYDRIDELIWVKTNQLQRIIRTGRTGHWLNHGKEHCLVCGKSSLQPVPRTTNTCTELQGARFEPTVFPTLSSIRRL